ncbi:MAG: DUF6982 domain-containing protein [Bryobacteraceae bacterium]
MTFITGKRVFLYRFDRLPIEGFASGSLSAGPLEVITQGGTLQPLVPAEIKAICFVSEGGKADLFTVDALFERRPKLPGLWTRFTFRDGEKLDGVLPHNLLDWPQEGYLLIPPKASSTRQRVFVPRSALLDAECRGVVGRPAPPGNKKALRSALAAAEQLPMFDSQP